jgi:hypothetical protein
LQVDLFFQLLDLAIQKPGMFDARKGESQPPAKRPLARGVLGFRIRTAPKKEYSVVKDQPDPLTGTVAPETATSPSNRSALRKNRKAEHPSAPGD